jgi:hypothetical protein
MKIKLFVIAIAAAAAGCAAIGGHALNRSPEIPKAQGTVRFESVAGDDTGIDLRVSHLEEPEGLTPPGYAYVAWVRATRDEVPLNVGSLVVGSDLTGELRTVTSLRSFEVFVTAEATSDVSAPTGERLLWASRN